MEIEWKESYNFGFKDIDRQHKELVDILNRLYDAILTNKTAEELKIIIKKLQEFSDEHFSTEENLFAKYNYPGAKEQKKEHDSFKKKLTEILNEKEDFEASISLAKFLDNWFIEHLLGLDSEYVEFFKKKGLK